MFVTVTLKPRKICLLKAEGAGGGGEELGPLLMFNLLWHGSWTWPAIRDFGDEGQLYNTVYKNYTCTNIPTAAAGMARISQLSSSCPDSQ